MCSASALDCEVGGTRCPSRRQRLSAIRKLSTDIQSERTLLKLPKNGLHLVLTQCADSNSRANRTSKPCLLLSCCQAVGGLRLAGRALSFAKLRSGKNREGHRKSRFRAGFVPSISRLFGERHARPGRSRRTFGAAAVSLVICNSGTGWRGQICPDGM